jgi:exonuclease III
MDPTKILIWNVRGLNSTARQDSVRTLVQSIRADVVCLQETKMETISQWLVFSTLGTDFCHFSVLPSVGASGGVLVAWRQAIGHAGSIRVDAHCVSVQFLPADGEPWWLTCVYGPQGNDNKINFLQELRLVRSNCHGPWVVAGDFNLIYKDKDKNNPNLNRAMMGRFRRVLDDLALKELPLTGRKFTWSSGGDSPTLSRLDRVFSSSGWDELFPNCLLQSAASQDSDHCPLILGLNDLLAGKGRFHFASFWPRLDGFQEVVAQAWSSVEARTCPLETLSLKFKAVTRALQSWSQKNIGHISSQLGLAREIIHQLEIAQDSRQLADRELWLLHSLKKHSLALSSLQRTIARVRSRINWLKDGDANTALFHSHIRHRKRKNFISKIVDGDHVLTSHDDKAGAIFEFYNQLIGTGTQRDSTINLDELGLSQLDLADLDVPITEEEVWNTIKHLPPDKAPGPDGFTGRFYKNCWGIIKMEVMAAVSELQRGNFRNLTLLNSALLTLLPKKDDAAFVKDFRPISLIHSFAKLVTKLLANRLAGRLNELVSTNQSAFVKGRCIHDNFLLVQQTARFLHQQKQPRILLKLDISKAFDSVSWPFLLEVLQKRGFGPIWRNMISGLLGSSSSRVLLNGVPGEVIYHRRGLRQGDPLSPMLFILVMDVLNSLFEKASVEGLLQPLSTRNIHHRVSLYADDVVLFLRPVAADLQMVDALLQLFGTAAGLRTNIQKSSISPIHCSEDDLAEVMTHFPCEIHSFPCKYLGLPLSLKKLSRAQLQPLIEKVASRLPGWKADLMSRAGRAIYVQSVLTSVLIYYATALELPPWCLKAVDKIRRNFLWRGRKETNGGHCLIAWPKVSCPKELGGLGILDLQKFGWALRIRWLWFGKTDPNKPWAAFSVTTHKNAQALFALAVTTAVGNGRNTKFWTDRWLNGSSIEQLAPHLFACVPKRRAKRRTVSEALLDDNWVQDIQGHRSVAVMAEYLEIWDMIQEVVLQPEVEDVHKWRFEASGVFSTQSAYKAFFIGSVQFEPYNLIWGNWAPRKCKFFLWLVAHNRCWTADRLARRGLPHPEHCPLCDQEDETIHHLLCSCVFSRQFWHRLFLLFGLPDVVPQPGALLFDWWQQSGRSFGKIVERGFNTLVMLGSWILWKMRNDMMFNGIPPRLDRALLLAQEEADLWMLAGAKGLRDLVAAARRG